MSDELATFDDALTARYVRNYPHPIDLVWEAVTNAEHLDIWLAPACGVVVDPRLGGRCEFWFGSPNPVIADHEADDRSTWAHAGTITEFVSPRVVHYQLADSALRFELTPIDGGTQLVFLHSFSPDFRAPHLTAGADVSYEAPGGPDSPWRPGFMAGFHVMLRQLGAYLDGSRTAEDARPYIEAVHAGHGVHELMHTLMTPAEVAEDERLAECYRTRIREELAPRR